MSQQTNLHSFIYTKDLQASSTVEEKGNGYQGGEGCGGRGKGGSAV